MNRHAGHEYGEPKLTDPIQSQRNPFETFLLGMSIFAAIPLIVGLRASDAVSAALPENVVVAWGACLLVGSLTATVGWLWRGKQMTGLVLERSGLILVAATALIYVVVVVTSVGYTGTRYVVGVQLAYAASCLWRAVQITQRFRWLRRHAHE